MHMLSDRQLANRAGTQAWTREKDARTPPAPLRDFEAKLKATQINEEGGCETTAASDEDVHTSRSIRHALIAMFVAIVILFVFNSGGLRIWVRNLPGNVVTDFLVQHTDRWHDFMKGIGTAKPKSVMQNVVADFRDSDWPDMGGLSEAQASQSDTDRHN